MLRVAPDPSTIEPKITDLYPGEILVVDWERCVLCAADVDGYIYTSGLRHGYCAQHYGEMRSAQ